MWTVTLTAAKLLGPTPLSATGNYGNKRSAHAHTRLLPAESSLFTHGAPMVAFSSCLPPKQTGGAV